MEEIYKELKKLHKEYCRKRSTYYAGAADGIDMAMMLIETAMKEEKGSDV